MKELKKSDPKYVNNGWLLDAILGEVEKERKCQIIMS